MRNVTHNQNRETESYYIFNTCSYASRFKLNIVEECAENAFEFLEKKQEEKRPPKADKEARTTANKLRKVKKSLEKQKTV
jgi:hypothetical protein